MRLLQIKLRETV